MHALMNGNFYNKLCENKYGKFMLNFKYHK